MARLVEDEKADVPFGSSTSNNQEEPDMIATRSLAQSIISGGQTGADQGALLAARDLGIPVKGYANKGWMTAVGPNPNLQEMGLTENTEDGGVSVWSMPDPSDRTSFSNTDRKNVDLADAVIAFRHENAITERGTEAAVCYALTGKSEHQSLPRAGDCPIYRPVVACTFKDGEKRFRRVMVVWNLSEGNLFRYAPLVRDFVESSKPADLMICGPCESTIPCAKTGTETVVDASAQLVRRLLVCALASIESLPQDDQRRLCRVIEGTSELPLEEYTDEEWTEMGLLPPARADETR